MPLENRCNKRFLLACAITQTILGYSVGNLTVFFQLMGWVNVAPAAKAIATTALMAGNIGLFASTVISDRMITEEAQQEIELVEMRALNP